MASYVKLGKKYRIFVSAGLDENGKQIRKTMMYEPKETAPTKLKKELDDVSRDFEKRIKNGEYYDGEKIRLKDFVSVWRSDWAVYHITESVQLSYLGLLNNHVLPDLGSMTITTIRKRHIQKILNRLIDTGRSPRTVKLVYTAINSVFRFALSEEYIEKNPCDNCTLPKLKHDTDLHYWELEQAKRFLAFLDQPYSFNVGKRKRIDYAGEYYDVSGYTATHKTPLQFKVFYTLAIYGGFRCGEMLALKWSDIDFEERTISINKAVAHLPGEQRIKEPKTPAAVRDIVLPDPVFDLLQLWKQEQKKLSVSLLDAWNGYKGKQFDQNYIFIQNDGSMMSLYTPGKKFKQLIDHYNAEIERLALDKDTEEQRDQIRLLKLPQIRLHDLRHTSATLLLANNVDIETVSRRLGHSRASVTLDIYGHAMKSKDRSAAEKLDKLFNDAPVPDSVVDQLPEEKRYS